jgi:hypothetical protein
MPKITIEARQAIVEMAKDPSRYSYWLERASNMTSIKQLYGAVEPRGSSEQRHIDEIASYVDTIDRIATPGEYIVEFFPWLRHLPTWMAPFKQEANALGRRHGLYFAGMIDQQEHKVTHKTSEFPESIARSYLKEPDKWDFAHLKLVWLLAGILGGAAGSYTTVMKSIILVALHYPEWQERIQSELDEVVGGDRLPTLDDSPNLPTLCAYIKETLRVRPVVAGGTKSGSQRMHSLTRDQDSLTLQPKTMSTMVTSSRKTR